MDKIMKLVGNYPKITAVVGIAFALFVTHQLWPYIVS